MYEELITVIAAQSKLLADAQSLSLDVTQLRSSDTTQCHSVNLVNYSITGSGGAVPPFVALKFNVATHSSAHYLTLRTPGRIDREQLLLVPVFPPGGAITETRTNTNILHRLPTKTVDLTKATIELVRFNATSGQFEKWDDWTLCVLTFQFVRGSAVLPNMLRTGETV